MTFTGVLHDADLFHDSLDRLLSSDEESHYPNHAIATSPNSASFPIDSAYHVWISYPDSVNARRHRLLRLLGLANSSLESSDGLSIVRLESAKSDGESCLDNDDGYRCVSSSDNNCDSFVSFSSDTQFIDDLSGSKDDDFMSIKNLGTQFVDGLSGNKDEDLMSVCTIKNLGIVDGLNENKDEDFMSIKNLDTQFVDGLRGNKDENFMSVCTIRNLDTGKEFVVNEVREMKEVGTGRNLTMEEFEVCVGHSPIVQELMRRQNVEDEGKSSLETIPMRAELKKGSWLRRMKNSMTWQRERRSSDERETASEKGGERVSSATDDSEASSFHGPERVRVKQYGKTWKELSGLFKSQEIEAHNGSIWSMKFSLDGRYLASAGEDCVIHVWQVVECEKKGDLLTMDRREDGNLGVLFLANGSPTLSPNLEGHVEKKRRGRSSINRKSVSVEHVLVPETVIGLSERPICSFQGHLDDVLDLSWSKSQCLLSSSMDKTVRLWHLSSNSCLKVFSHSDYVTCIQFNPVDDNYFISGSLDGKVRIWSIPDRQVVDWNDLHEMVTAACYTPDGQGALVGSYKGTCRVFNTSENKLQQKGHINLHNKKKRSHQKKITGFQFAPGSSSEVLITSADSRIRVIDDVDFVHKFKGFRNTNSQISASLTANGKYAVCASEDSHVYIWRHGSDSRPNRSKGATVTRSYEHFHCQDVSVAIPWPGMTNSWGAEMNVNEISPLASGCSNSPLHHNAISSARNSYFFDRYSVTWPEEKLILASKKHQSPRVSVDFTNEILSQCRSAWGMVIVTAGLRGEIRIFQNFGMPVRI